MKTFSFAALSEDKMTPRMLLGRCISVLKASEKENPLIKKILERIHKPSPREFEELKGAKIIVTSRGKIIVFVERCGKLKALRIFNLGTYQMPAFFYNDFIFVLDKAQDAFVPVDINVIYFNGRYVLGSIADNLLLKFDVKGLAPMGQFRSMHVLDDAYVVTTLNADEKIEVYGFGAKAEKLFEVEDESYFEVTEKGVYLKGEDGCIEDIYRPQDGIFECV